MTPTSVAGWVFIAIALVVVALLIALGWILGAQVANLLRAIP